MADYGFDINNNRPSGYSIENGRHVNESTVPFGKASSYDHMQGSLKPAHMGSQSSAPGKDERGTDYPTMPPGP